jgi:hypothetical protein
MENDEFIATVLDGTAKVTEQANEKKKENASLLQNQVEINVHSEKLRIKVEELEDLIAEMKVTLSVSIPKPKKISRVKFEERKRKKRNGKEKGEENCEENEEEKEDKGTYGYNHNFLLDTVSCNSFIWRRI